LSYARSSVPYYGNTQWAPPIEPDFVKQLMAWRKQCANYGKPGHASFCRRCDEQVFTMQKDWLAWLHGSPPPRRWRADAWPDPS
jgi:hypothetical protein